MPICTPSQLKQDMLLETIAQLNLDYEGERVVIKGCGDETIGEAVYGPHHEVGASGEVADGRTLLTVPVYKNANGKAQTPWANKFVKSFAFARWLGWYFGSQQPPNIPTTVST